VSRFLALVATLLMLAYGAIVWAAGASAPGAGAGNDDRCATEERAFQPCEDHHEADAPVPPADLDNDDDDNEEVFTQPSQIVPLGCRTTNRAEVSRETIQPSLGHPRGIDDPPRY
jgi:hypothetical protein